MAYGIPRPEAFAPGDTATQFEPHGPGSRRPAPGMLSWAFHEVKHNPPKILAKTRAKFGAADAKRQAIAITLSKAKRGY